MGTLSVAATLTDVEVRAAAAVATRFHDALQHHVSKHHCTFLGRVRRGSVYLWAVTTLLRACCRRRAGVELSLGPVRVATRRASACPKTSGTQSCVRWTEPETAYLVALKVCRGWEGGPRCGSRAGVLPQVLSGLVLAVER